MTKMRRLTALPLFLLLLLSFAPAGFAQEQDQQQTPPSDQQQTPPSDQQQTPPNDTTGMQLDQSISGELKSVDTDAKKIVVTTADGSDMEFIYNDETQCGGTQDTIEGLSTSSGSKVTVHYREENQQKVATRIEVEGESTTEETPQVSPQPDPNTPPSDTPNPPDPNRPPDNPEQPLPGPPQS